MTGTVAELREAILGRDRSSLEVVDALLARIEETEPALNAYVAVAAEEARAAARGLDAALAAGVPAGPLHGVPISVKDLYDTAGLRTAAGGRILADNVPERDATAVARLRAAGAIVVGKTNTHEYAYGYTTENPHWGDTHNPWDTSRTAGGSSGGSGASVAAGSAVAALGSDTGGSIRVPSSFCGIAGIKPTYGRVSRRGVFPLAWSLDHAGPMARTVRDLAILLGVLAGHDPGDPASADVPVPDYEAGLDGDIRGLRVGVPAGHFFDGVDPEVLASVRGAIDRLAGLGAVTIDVDVGDLSRAVGAWLTILMAEATAIHADDLRRRPADYGDDVRLYLELGTQVTATSYLNAQRIRQTMAGAFRAALAGVDVLVTPATAVPAPKLHEPLVRIGDLEEPLFRTLARVSSPFDMTGLPALSVPCGFTTAELPIGLQIVGKPFAEDVVLRAGHAFEQATEWASRRPPL